MKRCAQVMFLCVKDGSAPACASVPSPTVPSNSHCRNDRNACRHGFQNVDHLPEVWTRYVA